MNLGDTKQIKDLQPEKKVNQKRKTQIFVAKYGTLTVLFMVLGFLVHNPLVYAYTRTVIGVQAATCNCTMYTPDQVKGLITDAQATTAATAAKEATSDANLKRITIEKTTVNPKTGIVQPSFMQ